MIPSKSPTATISWHILPFFLDKLHVYYNVIVDFCQTCFTMFLVEIGCYNHMVLNHGLIREQAFGLYHSSIYKVLRPPYCTSKERPNTSWSVVNKWQITHITLYSNVVFKRVLLGKYMHVSLHYIIMQFGVLIGKLKSRNHFCGQNDCISIMYLYSQTMPPTW